MATYGFLKKDNIIGLDIGNTSIKLAEFTRSGGKMGRPGELRLVRVVMEEFSNVPTGGADEELAGVLKKLTGGKGIEASTVIANIACPQTAVRKITAPLMPKAELNEGVKLEAKKYFPFPVDNSLLDFEITGEVIEKGIKKHRLLVAVSPKKSIEKRLTALGKAGIRPVSLVPVTSALIALARVLFKDGKTRCFVDIGHTGTELIIVKNGILLFSREIPIGGKNFTDAMTAALSSDKGTIRLAREEAEEIKKDIGIPEEGSIPAAGNKLLPAQARSMLREPLEQLASEIGRCFDYYREEDSGSNISAIILSGRGALLKGLPRFLSEDLGVETRLAEAFGQPSSFAIAIGLALTGGDGINLLPPEIKEETKRALKRATLQALAAAVILTLAFLYIGMRIQLSNMRKSIPVAKMELASLGPQSKRAEVCRISKTVLVNEPYWDELFKELSNITPDSMRITRLSLEEGALTMEGVITSDDRENILSGFMLTLEKGLFGNVKLVTTRELASEGASRFKLRCRVGR